MAALLGSTNESRMSLLSSERLQYCYCVVSMLTEDSVSAAAWTRFIRLDKWHEELLFFRDKKEKYTCCFSGLPNRQWLTVRGLFVFLCSISHEDCSSVRTSRPRTSQDLLFTHKKWNQSRLIVISLSYFESNNKTNLQHGCFGILLVFFNCFFFFL